jgi:hypothetical protein
MPRRARGPWQGIDYSRLVLNPSGRPTHPYPQPPNHVRSIREARYKLAEYYDPSGKHASQWEMYDLKRDPLERKNLASGRYRRTPEEERQ